MDARQTYILDRINRARDRLLAAIEGLDAKTLSTEIIAGNWTAKDICDLRKRGVTPWIRAAVEHPAYLARTDTESIETLMKFHYRHLFDHARTLERWSRARSQNRA